MWIKKKRGKKSSEEIATSGLVRVKKKITSGFHIDLHSCWEIKSHPNHTFLSYVDRSSQEKRTVSAETISWGAIIFWTLFSLLLKYPENKILLNSRPLKDKISPSLSDVTTSLYRLILPRHSWLDSNWAFWLAFSTTACWLSGNWATSNCS